jgi:hypothetical protein
MMVRNGSAKQHSFNVDDFAVSGSPTGSGAPADADGDGMSDAWELAYGLNPSDAGDADADDDNDGLSNYHEYIAGTNPRDPSSTLSVGLDNSLDEQGLPEGFVLTWPSVWGKYYQVWKATNLISGFIMLEGGIESTPPINVYVDSTTPDAGSSFYRVEVE